MTGSNSEQPNKYKTLHGIAVSAQRAQRDLNERQMGVACVAPIILADYFSHGVGQTSVLHQGP